MSEHIDPKRLRRALAKAVDCRVDVADDHLVMYLPDGYIRITYEEPRCVATHGENLYIDEARCETPAELAAFARKIWLGVKYRDKLTRIAP